jgi:hypothetical protein
MPDFALGDRVRVLDVPGTGFYAGRVGEDDWVSRMPDVPVTAYRVKLDGSLPGDRAAFAPHELGPEASSEP